MLEKGRFIGLPSYIAIFLASLLFTGCFSVWFLIRYPESIIIPSANVLTFKNFSTSTNRFEVTQPYFTYELPLNDKSRLIDLEDFQFTMNHDTCNKTKPFLIMLIHSAPCNKNKRNVIRETWGRQTSSTATFFLVGLSEKYGTELKEEDAQYKDLIQGNFLDVYRNITYKHVMALKWTVYHCSSKILIFCTPKL